MVKRNNNGMSNVWVFSRLMRHYGLPPLKEYDIESAYTLGHALGIRRVGADGYFDRAQAQRLVEPHERQQFLVGHARGRRGESL
jgi:hypothetical protein